MSRFYLKQIIPLGFKRSLFVRLLLIKYLNYPIKIWFYRHDDFQNFGDEMSADVIYKLFKKKTTLVDPDEADLFAIGSIIEVANRRRYKKAYIWGSGFIRTGQDIEDANLIFKAVRGKKTRSRIPKKYQNVPIGDPGLLASLVYKSADKKTGKIGILPHYVDEDSPVLEGIKDDGRYILISVKDTPERVAKKITECSMVFSSSLHGLIVSDSFGVPNLHIVLSDKVVGDNYKFEDYYTSLDRPHTIFSYTDIYDQEKVSRAIDAYTPIEDLWRIQNQLIKSFPFR